MKLKLVSCVLAVFPLVACGGEEASSDGQAVSTAPSDSTTSPSSTPAVPSDEPSGSAPSPGSPSTPPSVVPTTTATPSSTSPEPGPSSPGAGGAPGSPEPTPPPPANLPADTSEQAVTDFVTQGLYEGEGWTAETDAPRDRSSVVSPHGRVRVHLNDILVASLAAGNGGVGTTSGQPHTPGSMAIKEMYDDSDVLVGRAALWQQLDGSGWLMFCYSPEQRCAVDEGPFTADSPFFEVGSVSCGGCHGGNIFTPLEE